ncbi:MAG: hypothetical protein ACRDJ4_16270 [Actinomycetota bacterium]
MAVLIVGVGVFGLVLLNVLTAQASFRASELSDSVEREEAQGQRLRQEVAIRESPERVAEAARSLGLVPPERQIVLPPASDEPSPSTSTPPSVGGSPGSAAARSAGASGSRP